MTPKIHIYMELPWNLSCNLVPTWESHIYMADPMQISLSKLQWSLRRASETHFSKLSDFIIRHPIFGGLSRRRCKCQNLVMFWKFNLTNLSGHMTDMLWIPLAVILWTSITKANTFKKIKDMWFWYSWYIQMTRRRASAQPLNWKYRGSQ